MKTSLKKITAAVLPLVVFLLIAPSSALAKRKHRHHDYDSYSRYDDDDCYRDRSNNRLSRGRWDRYSNGRDDNRYYDDTRSGWGHDRRYYDDTRSGWGQGRGYYDGRYSGGHYSDRPSYPGAVYNNPPLYEESPYGNSSSYYPPTTGVLPWLDILLPR
ncbi:MAG: hypothetical protein EXR78_09600 [Deltaproteobacteria bacterium]|nr:hypothetical protein [Deltaproteobacteria bacterium]